VELSKINIHRYCGENAVKRGLLVILMADCLGR
jgi:hypothetical protein